MGCVQVEIEVKVNVFQLIIKEFKAFPDHFVNFNIIETKGVFAAEVKKLADNLTDDEYEQFPGTPAVGRQLSLNVTYLW